MSLWGVFALRQAGKRWGFHLCEQNGALDPAAVWWSREISCFVYFLIHMPSSALFCQSDMNTRLTHYLPFPRIQRRRRVQHDLTLGPCIRWWRSHQLGIGRRRLFASHTLRVGHKWTSHIGMQMDTVWCLFPNISYFLVSCLHSLALSTNVIIPWPARRHCRSSVRSSAHLVLYEGRWNCDNRVGFVLKAVMTNHINVSSSRFIL